ncbi:phosphatidylserine synthase [Sinorhizobium fredii]
MKTIYVPVFKTAVNYTVSVGRRWTILEHLLLIELARQRRSSVELAEMCALPRRIVIEALIKLLQANWIELQGSAGAVLFAATSAGKKRAAEEQLPVQLARDVRWTSLCFERVTGSWLRSDDVSLVYDRELPAGAHFLPISYATVNLRDGNIKSLLYVPRDETLEQEEPRFTRPSQPFMRTTVSFGKVYGLPDYAPLRLRQEILEFSNDLPDEFTDDVTYKEDATSSFMKDTIEPDDIIIGGEQHLQLLRRCLDNAATTAIIHSCFVHPKVVEQLLPDLEKAAKRKVRVDLLWGLHRDPESNDNPAPIKDSEQILDRLPASLRGRVRLSSMSSGSHCKIIMYDDIKTRRWHTVVSSCNFLSSWYKAHDISIAFKSQQLAYKIMGWLIAAQQPASGAWPATARRLDRAWTKVREATTTHPENGAHTLNLLVDLDHYACIRYARDRSEKQIVLGCDLYGLAAETSAIVPLETAARSHKKVSIFYQRPSKILVAEGREPSHTEIAKRGIHAERISNLHAKFLMWDENDVVVSSFNWLSTVVDGSRQTGAEVGVWVAGHSLTKLFLEKAQSIGGLEALCDTLRRGNVPKSVALSKS